MPLSFFFKKAGTSKKVGASNVSEIGAPRDVTHDLSVKLDPETGRLTGLPEAWSNLLEVQQITPRDQQKNPTAVVHALNFFQKFNDADSKFIQRGRSGNSPETSATPSVDEDSNDELLDEDLLQFEELSEERDKEINGNNTEVSQPVVQKTSEVKGEFDKSARQPPPLPPKLTKEHPSPTESSTSPLGPLRTPTTSYAEKSSDLSEGVALRATGTVHLAVDRNYNNRRVAIKDIDLDRQPKKDLILMELKAMKRLSHPNLVNFLDAYLVQEASLHLWVSMARGSH
ncbi:unnamed protein product [Cyprideis torosa]|uniref:non-specific serine/threonine protein kinase n=1 Tax=Cyprideis torosa TaxID=163714 RepID=A0A7R8WAD4_9CRUS|nr:unnamed protein product [Cyprideis torosa]CAG0890857.1 unnamed protein product [Cyprideis torosa]